MSEEPSGDKEFEASARKLEKAREQGDIPRSQDVLSAVAMVGFLTSGYLLVNMFLDPIGVGLARFLATAHLADLAAQRGGGTPIGGHVLSVLLGFAPLFLVPALLVLVMLIGTRNLLFTPENLMPKLSRISPISGIKQKFGLQGILAFLKNFAKLVMVSVAVWWFLSREMVDLVAAVELDARPAAVLIVQLFGRFMVFCALIALLFGGLDWFLQLMMFLKKNKMTRKEMMDEHKESEGDPHAKSQRKAIGQEIALNRMIADVAKADVVIVNPTHYAVALQWERGKGRVPRCVAKGTDELAARIRQKATSSGVPIYSDPPTARAIHATVEVGEDIHRVHYRAVAVAIRFAESVRKKKTGM